MTSPKSRFTLGLLLSTCALTHAATFMAGGPDPAKFLEKPVGSSESWNDITWDSTLAAATVNVTATVKVVALDNTKMSMNSRLHYGGAQTVASGNNAITDPEFLTYSGLAQDENFDTWQAWNKGGEMQVDMVFSESVSVFDLIIFDADSRSDVAEVRAFSGSGMSPTTLDPNDWNVVIEGDLTSNGTGLSGQITDLQPNSAAPAVSRTPSLLRLTAPANEGNRYRNYTVLRYSGDTTVDSLSLNFLSPGTGSSHFYFTLRSVAIPEPSGVMTLGLLIFSGFTFRQRR